MTGTARALAGVAATLLWLGPLAPGVLAQAVVPPTPRAAPGEAPPTAQLPNPQTPMPKAESLESYFGMLQTVGQQLADDLARVEAGARSTQTGAMSPDAIHLRRSVLAARDAIARAPESFEDNPVQSEAARHMRESSVTINRGRMEQSEMVDAAKDVQQWLERLRAEVGKAVPRRPS